MVSSSIKMISLILQDLHASSSDILASALVSNDGLPIAFRLPEDVEPDRVGGMTAAMFSLGGRAAREMKVGKMQQVMVQGDDGLIVLIQASAESSLIITAKQEAKLGLVLLNARQAVKQIIEWIEE